MRIAPRFALALIVMIGLFWTVAAKNINYLRADVGAANAFASNDIDEAIEYLDGSVSLAPDIPIYYRRRAETLKQHMNVSEDVQYRAQLAEMIYADRFLAAQTDPLAGESLFGQANAALDLNRLGYEGKGQEAAIRTDGWCSAGRGYHAVLDSPCYYCGFANRDESQKTGADSGCEYPPNISNSANCAEVCSCIGHHGWPVLDGRGQKHKLLEGRCEGR